MKVSVYTSLFNYSPDKFDLNGAFSNWSKYADEIVIATFKDQELPLGKIIFKDYFEGFYQCAPENEGKPFIKLIGVEDTSLNDPLFDGKLKNAALQVCSNNTVIQQDFDERIGGDIEEWEKAIRSIYSCSFPIACMIPVIDLYKDLDHYKGINQKWYLHQKEGMYRGPVYFAKRPDGSIDITKSDSCELVNDRDELVPSTVDRRFIDTMDTRYPHIIHTGYLDLNKRVENNKFWGPIWSARNGSKVKVAQTLEEVEAENEAKKHNLGREWWA